MLLRQARPDRRLGFTLTELMIVVAIIVILAGIAVPITMNVMQDARKSTAQAVIKGTLVPAITRYKLKHDDQLPTSLDDLVTEAGVKRDMLYDPWKHKYNYTPQTQHNAEDGFDIWSDGPPGQNTPIGNW